MKGRIKYFTKTKTANQIIVWNEAVKNKKNRTSFSSSFKHLQFTPKNKDFS